MNERTPLGLAFERRIGRLLISATYLAVALLLVGVALMAINGISPLDVAPPLDPGALVGDLVAVAPVAFLWLGLLTVIATPISRVLAAAVGYARVRDRTMTLVSVGILFVVVVGVILAVAGGG
jgi:uncharacterized membrane protein